MNVGELKGILEAFPDDMEIFVPVADVSGIRKELDSVGIPEYGEWVWENTPKFLVIG